MNAQGMTPLSLATKLDKIKLEKNFSYHRKNRSWVRRSNSKLRNKFLDWDISAISGNKVPNWESGLNSPSFSNGMSKFLFSPFQSNKDDGKSDNLSKIEEWKEDISNIYKRPNRREYGDISTSKNNFINK